MKFNNLMPDKNMWESNGDLTEDICSALHTKMTQYFIDNDIDFMTPPIDKPLNFSTHAANAGEQSKALTYAAKWLIEERDVDVDDIQYAIKNQR